MSCKITYFSLVQNIKDKITGNATSFQENEYSIHIPVGNNIPNINVTKEIADRKVKAINEEYNSEAFGAVASTANTPNGTLINIHPSQVLINSLNYIHSVDDDTKLSQEALDAQENREETSQVLDNIKGKEFNTKQAVIKYLKSVTNPMFYSIKRKGNGS